MELKRLKFIDRTFVSVLIILIAFGLLVLSSATYASSSSFTYLSKQIGAFVLGIVAAIFVIRYDYIQLKRYGWALYGISIFLLLLVFAIGSEIRGTQGWIQIGPLPPLQPAEFTKVILIVAFADFLSSRKGSLNTFKEILPCILFMGIPWLIIMAQKDLGTGLVYIVITLVMMYFAGANPKILFGLFGGAAAVVALALFLHFHYGMWIPLKDYQLARLTVFVNPTNDGSGGKGAGWNTLQSLIAIGSGGATGKGLYHGTQVQQNFLPEHHTDFIYAVIGEELGFLGALFVIILYSILLIRAIAISFEAKELYGTLLVVGISAMWLFHIFENIGMSLGVMPVTGIPLPFLSYGGTAMLTNMIAAGLIVGVNLRGNQIVF